MVCGLELFQNFIKKYHVDFLLNKFSFSGYFDLKNGEEIPIPSRKINFEGYERMIWRKAIYRHIEIRIGYKHDNLTRKDSYHLKVIGSLHKYFKNGDNSGLFTAIDAMTALNELCNELEIDKKCAKITSIEIGVNLKLWFDVFDYFKRNLLRYKFVFFKEMESDDKRIIGWVANLSHYVVKLYCKGSNILRFEVRYGDTQKLKKDYRLHFVSDLTPDLIIKMAENEVLSKWNDVVGKGGLGTVKGYYPISIKQKELEILKDFASKSYLDEIGMHIQDAISKNNSTEKNRLTRMRDRGRDKYEFLVNKYSEDNNLQIIYGMIQQRINDEKEKCVFFDIGIKVKKYTEVFSKDINTEIQDSLISTNKRNIMEETPVINPIKSIQNNLTNNNNSTMKEATTQINPSVSKVNNKQHAKERNLQAETTWNNSMKAVGETLQQLKDKTGKLE